MYDQMGHHKENVMKAFPRPNTIHPDDLGMDLRDYFAAKAMQAIMTNDTLLREAAEYRDDGSEFSVAILAYEQADAMMKVRNDKE